MSKEPSQASHVGENDLRTHLATLVEQVGSMATRLEALERRNEAPQPNPFREHVQQGGRGRGHHNRYLPRRGRYINEYDNASETEEDLYDHEVDERPRRNRREDELDKNLGSIKMTIPSFQGKNDPDAYITWERKVELVFECHHYSEEKKIKLAVVEFTDYAIAWWDQLVMNRRRAREPPITTWEEMKTVMRKRFVPSHYYRDLHQRLQTLTQGSKTVDEYFKEMEIAMIRANIEEDREATMARFLNGLNKDIGDRVELQHYVDLEDMVHMAIKIERQLKNKKSSYGKPYGTSSFGTSSSKVQNAWPKKEHGVTRPSPKEEAPKPKLQEVKPYQVDKGKNQAQPPRNRDVKCYKCLGYGHISTHCPNKRTMVVKRGEIQTDSESEVEENLLESEEEEHEYGENNEVEGDDDRIALVLRRALNVQIKEEDEGDEVQRENLFHTRCKVLGRLCGVVIDNGSCVNVASKYMVDKLKLRCINHPKPYKLQWLSDCGELKVTKQVRIPFSIGKLEDEVLCDVVPM